MDVPVAAKLIEVMARYWDLEPVAIAPATPGFSGAVVLRVTTGSGTYACRLWPLGAVSATQLAWIHARQTQAAQACEFVPKLIPSLAGTTALLHESRFLEVAVWMPGRADFQQHPTQARLLAAVQALARLHQVWSEHQTAGPCPAALRRHQRLAQWTPARERLLLACLDRWPSSDQANIAIRAARLLSANREDALGRLQQWCRLPLPLQPCLADVWHDHVLFMGDQVTGIVDFGATRWDHPAVDLARLLGSLVGFDNACWAAALNEYVWPLRTAEARAYLELPRLLHWTGLMASLVTWLQRLVFAPEPFPQPERAWQRFEDLTNQLARYAGTWEE
jgi:Ser/Thr protein kinase RdoA (MazF antagonist)